MKLDYQTKNKLIDAIGMLNNRFYRLLGKPLGLTRDKYLASPLLHIGLDRDPDSAGVITTHIHNQILADHISGNTYQNIDTNIISGLERELNIQKMSTYELSNILQAQIINDLLVNYLNNRYPTNNENKKLQDNNNLHAATLTHYLVQQLMSKAKYLNDYGTKLIANNSLDKYSDLYTDLKIYSELIKYMKFLFIKNTIAKLPEELSYVKNYIKYENKLINSNIDHDYNYLKLCIRATTFIHYLETINEYTVISNNTESEESFNVFMRYLIFITPMFIKDFHYPIDD